MRFLLANNHCITDPTAGVTHTLRTIMRWLQDAGHPCHILTTARFTNPVSFTIEEHLADLGVVTERNDESPSVARFNVDGVPITLLLTRHNDETYPDIAETTRYGDLFQQLLKEFVPDQVIACNAHPMIQNALRSARQRRITTVFTVRDGTYYDSRYFEAVDHVFSASQFMTDRYFETLGLVSTPLESPIDWSEVVAPEETRAFVTFVNPIRRKGVMLFARLADMLGSRRPDIPLLVIQSGHSAGFLNAVPGLDFRKYPQIKAALRTATPAEYLALTRILLVPSLFESFGRVAAEAMINATPAIVSDRPNLPHVVGGDFAAGGGARVLPLPAWMTHETLELPTETEVQPWFDTVSQLWDDPVLYGKIADRAFQIAKERFSEEVSRERHVRYFTSLKTTQ